MLFFLQKSPASLPQPSQPAKPVNIPDLAALIGHQPFLHGLKGRTEQIGLMIDPHEWPGNLLLRQIPHSTFPELPFPSQNLPGFPVGFDKRPE
jgi:hypothetical protein